MPEPYAETTSNDLQTHSAQEKMGEQHKKIKLKSLAPEFKNEHHHIYVRHLEEAVQNNRNRNIALTGRYGAGKSSILDSFEGEHADKTIRISINTLGPDENDEDLTNRIQKELVKQLVYRLQPGQVRRSRFARPVPLTRSKAFIQALAITTIGLMLLWLFGVRPAHGWPGEDLTNTGKVLLGVAFFLLVMVGVWAIRWAIGDRFVSEVTTAGTKIALSEGPTTYFDSFLDEIVAFFEAVDPEFVIFEDLDRFEDPQIFDSLRELNTLVNSSAHWQGKEQPLRFIYAIKDSVFEQLGTDRALTGGVSTPGDNNNDQDSVHVSSPNHPKRDVAAEAVRRANRTKFFEIVIPIVPFLSHRNARDHLSDALTALGFPKDFVSRPLLDLVARHTTDMRLMINICNEFAVFVERLLWTEKVAPGMTADHLFALVVYKNFHLADFEKVPLRESTLDTLEKHHRDDVRSLIDGLQTKRRTPFQVEEHRKRSKQMAADLGLRLNDLISIFPNNYPASVAVGGKVVTTAETSTPAFWKQVATQKSLTVKQQGLGQSTQIDATRLDRIFPELGHAEYWGDPSSEDLAKVTKQLDDEISMLRGSDFVGLSLYDRSPEGHVSFSTKISESLDSKLASDLVRQGYITRNYAEYSAIFYGSFTGVDVAYFYNHSVQPNEMYLDFSFTTPNAVANLLEQVPADFTSSVSALNMDVVDFLLAERPQLGKQVVEFIVTHIASDEVQAFLTSFVNSPGSEQDKLFELLASHPWDQVFEYISGHEDIPDVLTRARLFNAALMNSKPIDSYDIAEATHQFIDECYQEIDTFTGDQTPTQITLVIEMLKSSPYPIPDLKVLSKKLRHRVVTERLYLITVSNLKSALSIPTSPTFDEVRNNPDVWSHCRDGIDIYLKAMQADDTTGSLIESEQVLVGVINDTHESWTTDQIQAVVQGTADSVAITDLKDIPEQYWPLLFKYRHIASTAANVASYVHTHGIDEQLSAYLSPTNSEHIELGEIEAVEEEARAELAIDFLNAHEHLSAKNRVSLAAQVFPGGTIDLDRIIPVPDQLLAQGLEVELLEDDLETFAHFASGGWDAMRDAFGVSENVADFLSPEIVEGFVPEFLESSNITRKLKEIVLKDLAGFVPNNDAPALSAAGEYARTASIKLPLEQVRRIAPFAKSPVDVARQLVMLGTQVDGDEIIEVLALLGEPYSKLAEGPPATFEYPRDAQSSVNTIFNRLETAGHIKITKDLIGSGKKVEVLK